MDCGESDVDGWTSIQQHCRTHGKTKKNEVVWDTQLAEHHTVTTTTGARGHKDDIVSRELKVNAGCTLSGYGTSGKYRRVWLTKEKTPRHEGIALSWTAQHTKIGEKKGKGSNDDHGNSRRKIRRQSAIWVRRMG